MTGSLFGRQHVGSSLIALATNVGVSFHLSSNRVPRNSRQDHARAALWAGRGCVFSSWLAHWMHSGTSMRGEGL